ncbi:MAG: hypothetical protein QHC65_14210 [Sphingomonas sp.]|nr:hypothetical protein [Sphingomonas sp.]MDX3885571.1 hypothetical protein [Sphingomonas sp.]
MTALARPETAMWVVSAEAVDHWAREAEAGAVLTYAHGREFPRIAGAIRVGQLAGRGIVHPFFRRIGREFDFQARLLRRPGRAGDGMRADACDLLRYLREQCRVGHAMPTGAAIAMDLGLRGETHANNLLHRLRRQGVIDWRLAGGRGLEPSRRVLARIEAAA